MFKIKLLKPLQNLWILFCIQAAVLIFFLVAFMFFQPRFAHLISGAEERHAKWPLVEQRVKTASPEQLRKDALTLIDTTELEDQFVESMHIDLMKIFGLVCFVLFILTIYLGICVFQFQRQSRKKMKADLLRNSILS